MIFRVDDVSTNTDFNELAKMSKAIYEFYPDAKIWYGVTLFSRHSPLGSVYPDPPFKNNDNKYFYDVDQFRTNYYLHDGKVISHGLIHIDHSRLGYDGQEMSILSSCRYLKTDTFMPPFGLWDTSTKIICKINGINLIEGDDWKSTEFNEFDPSHEKWYFHAWRYDAKAFAEKIQPKALA